MRRRSHSITSFSTSAFGPTAAQIDDMLPGTPHPVILSPISDDSSASGWSGVFGGGGGNTAYSTGALLDLKPPLLYFAAVVEPGRRRGALYCPCIVARVLPLRVALGEPLMWRLVSLAEAVGAASAAAAARAGGEEGATQEHQAGRRHRPSRHPQHHVHSSSAASSSASASGLPLQVSPSPRFLLHLLTTSPTACRSTCSTSRTSRCASASRSTPPRGPGTGPAA